MNNTLPGTPFFHFGDNGLMVEKLTLSDLAQVHGTPLYVYSKAAMLGALAAYQKGFAGRKAQICYAMKANSSLAVLQVFARAGCGFDIVSIGELARVQAAGGDVAKVIFSGVGKTRAEMRSALHAGIGCFNVESEAEIDVLNEVALQEGLRARGASAGCMDASGAAPPDFDESWAMVLMDDVHLYSAEQQHTAFGWFVQAHSLQRTVLAAGSSAPTDLLLREDLRTRLGWGHIFVLQPLGEAHSRAVLRQAADARGLFLSDEVMDYTLRRFSRDLGSLLALLDELDRYALQTQRAITIPLIRSMLENT